MAKKRTALSAILAQKCPRCRSGNMYVSTNPYNLKKLAEMPEKCEVCEQPFSLEPGFYFGATYVSYAFTVAYMITAFVFNWLVIKAEIMTAMPFVIGGFVLLSPFIFRLSRVVYLGFFVRYNPKAKEMATKSN